MKTISERLLRQWVLQTPVDHICVSYRGGWCQFQAISKILWGPRAEGTTQWRWQKWMQGEHHAHRIMDFFKPVSRDLISESLRVLYFQGVKVALSLYYIYTYIYTYTHIQTYIYIYNYINIQYIYIYICIYTSYLESKTQYSFKTKKVI